MARGNPVTKMAKSASKTTRKQIKKSFKNLPGRKKQGPVGKAGSLLSSGGGLVAGALGTVAAKQGLKAAGNKAKSAMSNAKESGGTAGKLAEGAENLVTGGKQDTANVKLREIIQEYIDVSVPREFAYESWTDYESLSGVFKGITLVKDEDEESKWQAKIGPVKREWSAQINEDVEERKIDWESKGGEDVIGVIAFHELDDNLTRIMVQMEYHPKGALSSIGNLFRMQRRRVRRDLRLFKHHVELKADEDEKKTKSKEDADQSGQQQEGKSSGGDGQTSSGNGSDNGNEIQLEEKTVEELRKAASVLGVENYRQMNKKELVEALDNR
jgi:uncharacterized membrane protein